MVLIIILWEKESEPNSDRRWVRICFLGSMSIVGVNPKKGINQNDMQAIAIKLSLVFVC